MRAAGNHFLGLAHVRNDRLERQAHAAGHAGQRHRRAHHFQKAAARNRIDPLGSALGKFAVQRFLERGAAGKFFEAAPVFRTGLFGGILRDSCFDSLADGVQIQLALLAGANVFSPGGFVLLFHSFAHFEALRLISIFTHGLRRGLHSVAAPRLASPVTRVATGNVFHAAHVVLLHQRRSQVRS